MPLTDLKASPQPQPSVKAPLAAQSLLLDIQRLQNNRLVAVGERGHIVWSDDGSVWQQAAVPVRSNLTSVYFIDELRGWAVGHDATIIHSDDGGESWHLQQFAPELDKPLLDIVFQDARQGLAIGAYGLLFRTEDGGESWQTESHIELLDEDEQDYLLELKDDDPELYALELSAIFPHFNRFYRDGDLLLMVGEAGFFAISEDFGQQWELQEPFYHGSLFDIAMIGPEQWLAVGLRSHVFLTEDAGDSWQEIVLDSQATINSVIKVDDVIYLSGNAGLWAQSDDQGRTFSTRVAAEGRPIVNAVPFQNRMILVTELGIQSLDLKKPE
ncbi:MAG: hypothetical protein LAT66_01720 [Alkalimonas sp.]|nr:hypothetical protein [Alkalimonas sp.]